MYISFVRGEYALQCFIALLSLKMNVTTSIPRDIWQLAKNKHLKWSECLCVGIKKLAFAPFVETSGETIGEETEKNQIEKLKSANHQLQEAIIKLEDEKND